MAVIPGCPVLQHSKVVCPRATPRNWALGQGHAVLIVVVVLTKTVPVDNSSFIVEVVGDMNNDRVSPAGFYQGSGIGAIEETGLSSLVVRGNGALVKVQMILK